MISFKTVALLCFSAVYLSLNAQDKNDQIFVDDNGVMRWSADNSELHGFGVNYTLPFAHEYRIAMKTGLPPEDLIRQDVYHMARLDLDFYRVHVWDTEISDTLGNLLDNEHLRLFDFLLAEMKLRGIRFIITPIAYWGNGWPEPDELTPGFSLKYGKEECLTNPEAIDAQAKYLNQFLKHINPYTGIAYKDEPHIIGFEISNEPHHSGSTADVTSFINKMVASMRQTGCTKLIFYNMSHSVHLAEGYLNAQIQGGTFQWYPTNLVANHEIKGNFLPHIESYIIPFAGNPLFKKMAKIVYEFDPADVAGNIMYPAMACTFREAGMQLAAHFAYDAMCSAPFNTNYGTHFMNLAYAPQKAISLKIASAVFHQIPMYEQHSSMSDFGSFRISYTDNLAEWVTNEKFFYTNNTISQPADLSLLKEIAGYGSSPLVKYNGKGAYFLDKISNGVWRLEIMPDAYWIDDPYSPASLAKQKAAVLYANQDMTIALPDLGKSFIARPINKGNTFNPEVSDGQLTLKPGVYLLSKNSNGQAIRADQIYKNIKIGEFVAPVTNLNKTVLWNYSATETSAGMPYQLNFEAVSPDPIKKITISLSNGARWKSIIASHQENNRYHIELPSDLILSGILRYRIFVEDNDDTITFPGGYTGDPWSLENKVKASYAIRIMPDSSFLVLWDAENDWESTYKVWNKAVDLKPTQEGEIALFLQLDQLPEVDPLNKNDRNYAFKYYFGEKLKGRLSELPHKKFIVIGASNALPMHQIIEVGLIDKNGSVLAGEIEITQEGKLFKIPVSALKIAPYLIIPRPFPDFLPCKEQPNNMPFDWTSVEMVQLNVKQGKQEKVDLIIENIWME